MAGQQPAHWRPPQGKGHSTSTSSLTPMPAGSGSSSATVPTSSSSVMLLAASAVPVLPSMWTTCDYDLSCASVVGVTDGQPSDEVLACLSAPGHTCLLNSGTFHNLVCDQAYFHAYSVNDSVWVQTASHGYLLTSGSGECVRLLAISSSKHKVKFSGCLPAPGAMLNLLSVGWMLTKGWECHSRGGPSCCDVSYRTSALGSIPLQNNPCFLDLEFLHFNDPLPILQTPTPLAAFAHIAITHDLWHAHLGHIGRNAAHHAVHFADGLSSHPLFLCLSANPVL